MAFSLGFDAVNRIGCMAFAGALSGQLFLQGMAAARKWIDENGPSPMVYDFTGVTEIDLDPDALKEFALAQPILPDEINRVIVVPQSEALHLARLFQSYSGKRRPPLQVVRSMDDACTFLGVKSLALVEAVRG